jgi:hypothetical protein
MAYQVTDIQPKPLFAVRVADADTGEPRRMSVFTGEAVVVTQATGLRIITGALPREPCGLFVPDARPIEPHETPVIAQAEAYLCGVIINGNVDKQSGYGVGEAAAAFVPDPRGGPMRWLQLTFTATTLVALRMGYRITMLTPG